MTLRPTIRRVVRSCPPTDPRSLPPPVVPDLSPGVPQYQGQQGADIPRGDEKYRRANIGNVGEE